VSKFETSMASLTIHTDISAFTAAMRRFSQTMARIQMQFEAFGSTRSIRRMRGYHPETPARSAMHSVYRAKTRRRNRR